MKGADGGMVGSDDRGEPLKLGILLIKKKICLNFSSKTPFSLICKLDIPPEFIVFELGNYLQATHNYV